MSHSLESDQRINELSRSAASIKQTTQKIHTMMRDDEALTTEIDKGLVKNQTLLRQTVSRVDKLLTSASSNVLCYTLLFFVMVLGLLYKLTK